MWCGHWQILVKDLFHTLISVSLSRLVSLWHIVFHYATWIVSHLHTLSALFRTDTHIHIHMCIFNSAIWINKRATEAIKENSSSIHKYVECKNRKMLGFFSHFHFIHKDISYSFYVKRSFVIPVVSFVLVSPVPPGTYKVNIVRWEIWNWRELNAILLCNFLRHLITIFFSLYAQTHPYDSNDFEHKICVQRYRYRFELDNFFSRKCPC